MLDRWIGNYHLVERLGAGGMGEVYRAADSRLNRHVALKILSPEHAVRPHSVERFRREARSVAALNHPNIVTIYSVEEHEGLHFLTMELVQGRTLSSVIPPEGLPLRRLLEIAAPLAEALEAAHERGIVHRDLKPANVMVSGDRVKVLDFGIAKSEPDAAATIVEGATLDAASLTGTGLVIGTPAYMSPEQALGRTVDHRTDIFSFGVMLYEMATGCRPFRGEAASETVAAVLRDTPPAPSSLNPRVPEVLDKLIAGCLEKDPSRRIQTARELRLSLQALAVGLSTPALSFPTDTTPMTRLRRRWAAPAAALAGTCCLVLMLAVSKPQLQHLLAGADKAAAIRAGEAAVQRPGLAVLPLGNFSKDPEYFVDGMTDALIASLSDIQGVRVISRQSVMRFKSSSEPLPAIARELGVDIIVQGSVMRAGDRVRITAQLLRADPEQQIWARSYERDFRDVLTLQNEVARAISREIQVKLEPADERRLGKPRPVDPQAYDAYLKGRHAWNQRTAAGFADALKHFQRALDLDPGFALAHAGLADAYSLSTLFGMAFPEQAFPKAREHAKAALELDPELADAHVSLGLVRLFADRDWNGAEESFRRAIALHPSHPTAHHFYALHLLARKREKEGLQQLEIFHGLDPLSPAANVNMGLKAYNEGRTEEALHLFEKARTLAPDYISPYLSMSQLHSRQGDEKQAFEHLHKALSVRYGEIMPEVDRAYRKGGERAALQAAAESLEELSRTRVLAPEDIARVYLRLGEKDKALDCLEEVYLRGFPRAILFESSADWEWRALRSEPRFRQLMARIGSQAPAAGSRAPGQKARGCAAAAAAAR